jgi:hypothetical protein
MKKILLFIAMVTFGFSNAQIKEKGAFEITPKIGTSSFSELNEQESTNYNAGAEIGVTLDYYFNDRWSLRSGLIANKMGGKYTVGTDRYEEKFNYLSIPANINWHFGSTRKWNLNFGLSPSFLTNAAVVINGRSFELPKTALESFQMGLTYGIGYKIGITEKFGILIDAQFFNGLTNINNVTDERIVNGGYSLNIGGVIQL